LLCYCALLISCIIRPGGVLGLGAMSSEVVRWCAATMCSGIAGAAAVMRLRVAAAAASGGGVLQLVAAEAGLGLLVADVVWGWSCSF